RYPDQNEFWNTGSANTAWGDEQDIGYRSWIHHTMLGSTNFTVIEDAMGLRPRSDGKIELDPIDIDWPYFMANNIRYRNVDLSVVWDEPGDGQRPYGEEIPEGYSLFIDGELAFTADSLGRIVYDPAAGTIVDTDEEMNVSDAGTFEVEAPQQVRFDDDARVVGMFAKAGTDIATATTGTANLAEDEPVSATYTSEASFSSPEAAVDGATINEAAWGTDGSPNAQDSLVVDLGEEQTFDDLRVYFYRTSSSDSPQGGRLAGTRQGYAAPQTYTLEYFDGQDWQTIPDQARTPAYPRGNYNHIQFPAVTGSKVRLTATHMPGQSTGNKELQVFDTGIDAPAAQNLPPEVRAHIDPGYDRPGATKVTGTVRDDAAPSDELTVQWSVVDAPQDATVLIEDARSATTVVRHSAPGDYTLRLTADDGAAQTSKDVHFTVTESDSSRRNVGPSATPSASFTAGWNDVNAVNDGEGRNTGGSQDELW